MLTFDDLLHGFSACGFRQKDVVMLHSSYKSFGGVEGGAETVVSALQELTTPEGSALFLPRYGVEAWCQRHYWDTNETPGEMGIIPEVGASFPGARRTQHPIHNFQILGPWQHEYNFENRESYGADGPFGLFHRRDGLVISAGVGWSDTFTFVHYVERAARAAWRRLKSFSGIYVDHAGRAQLRSYDMSVRLTQAHVTDVDALYDLLLVPAGVVKQTQIGASTVSWFRCGEYYDAVFEAVKQHPEYFYRAREWYA